MIIKIYDGRVAEIHIDLAEEIPDALVRMLIAQGATSAKIIKSKPATGEPAINVAQQA
jgi:hypothetical protein